MGSLQRTVTSDNNKRINVILFYNIDGLLLSLFSHEFFTSGSFEYSAASPKDIAHAARIHFQKLSVDQTLVSPEYTYNLKILVYGFSDNTSYSGIHPRRVSSGSQNSDPLNFVHRFPLCSDCFVALRASRNDGLVFQILDF